jgi:hypothetical protein
MLSYVIDVGTFTSPVSFTPPVSVAPPKPRGQKAVLYPVGSPVPTEGTPYCLDKQDYEKWKHVPCRVTTIGKYRYCIARMDGRDVYLHHLIRPRQPGHVIFYKDGNRQNLTRENVMSVPKFTSPRAKE